MKNTTNECIAMLLAGGEGRRLSPLTGQIAKPVVPFGDRFRMIDFPLNNCVHSNINKIGVLTQYCADSVHNYINEDQPSLLTSNASCDITMLPSSNKCKDGYAGTADAIYQNIDYIDQLAPEHVLILSGDHIYQMDYRPMLEFHKSSGAPATIAVKKVAWREASRFGILNTDDQYRVKSFVEKPAKPQSNLASMGIYLFRWSELKKHLIEDAANPHSTHDFGKDIIPAFLAAQANMVAYPYKGYWRDVGTIDSLWEANMDLLDGELKLTNYGKKAEHSLKHTVALGKSRAKLNNEIIDSILHPACTVEAQVERSIVCSDVTIGMNSEIHESIIMPGARIGRNVNIHRAIIGEGAIIEDGAVIGRLNDEICVVGHGEVIRTKSRAIMDYNMEPLGSIANAVTDREHSNINY